MTAQEIRSRALKMVSKEKLELVAKTRKMKYDEVKLHREVVNIIAKMYGYSFRTHDFIKGLNIIFLGDDLATKIHRLTSRHHVHGDKIPKLVEAIFDWESARFTKPEKPLNALDTWKKHFSNVKMPNELISLMEHMSDNYKEIQQTVEEAGIFSKLAVLQKERSDVREFEEKIKNRIRR